MALRPAFWRPFVLQEPFFIQTPREQVRQRRFQKVAQPSADASSCAASVEQVAVNIDRGCEPPAAQGQFGLFLLTTHAWGRAQRVVELDCTGSYSLTASGSSSATVLEIKTTLKGGPFCRALCCRPHNAMHACAGWFLMEGVC